MRTPPCSHSVFRSLAGKATFAATAATVLTLGPAALGISAHSTVLTTWAQGGPIALHGTNEPGLLGRAASHGCIRLDNRVMRRLFAATHAGNPIIIRR